MEVIVDSLRERPADAMHLGQIRHACLTDALQPTELPEQGAPALGAQAIDGFQGRCHPGRRPALAMPGNGEAVGLVPDLLDEQQRR